MTLCANSSSIVTFSSHRPKCPCCLACYLPSISQLHSLHFHSFNRMRCIGQTNSLLLHAPVHPLTSLIFDTVRNPTSFTAYGKNTHTHTNMHKTVPLTKKCSIMKRFWKEKKQPTTRGSLSISQLHNSFLEYFICFYTDTSTQTWNIWNTAVTYRPVIMVEVKCRTAAKFDTFIQNINICLSNSLIVICQNL